jgi:hypothetical protein
VSAAVVKQRLKLASVPEKLLAAYAEDQLTLEQLMAFTVTSDHARQEREWAQLVRSYDTEPYQIRRQLTEGAIRATDRRAQFDGIPAYEAAGGLVTRDLFEPDGGGWLQDAGLLDRLAIATLQAAAQAMRGDGWKWIEVAVDFPYGHTAGLRHLDGQMVELTTEERTAYEAFQAEYERLEREHAEVDDLPEEVDQRLGEIERAIDASRMALLAHCASPSVNAVHESWNRDTRRLVHASAPPAHAARSHVLLRFDESEVRDEVAELLSFNEDAPPLAADQVTDADIGAACRAVADGTDLAEEKGAAVHRAALAAIRAARQRQTR